MLESSCFRTPLGSQHVNGSQTLLKPVRQHFYPKFPLLSDKFSCKAPVLVISEILGLFLKTMTAYHMDSPQN